MNSAPDAIDQIDPAERIESLRARVAHHNERYHTLDSPEISDADYDALVRELRALEADHPELTDESSPSRQVRRAVRGRRRSSPHWRSRPRRPCRRRASPPGRTGRPRSAG